MAAFQDTREQTEQKVVTNDLNPAKMPTRIIDDLRSQEIEDGIIPVGSLLNFVKGEKVHVIEGAFKDQIGIFESMDDK